MRADETRLWMVGDDPVTLLEQLLQRRVVLAIEVPVGMADKLGVALIVRVQRLEEGVGIGNMDHYGNVQLAGRLPQRIEATIVHVHELAIGISYRQPQLLVDLQALRPVAHGLFKLRARSAHRSPAHLPA